jgi:hypothetical protein
MRVPGSNLLSVAMRVINPQPLKWRMWLGRVKNARGVFVDSYAPLVDAADIYGSAQPVSRALYQQLGLEFSKIYYTLWVQYDVRVLNRDTSGDVVLYNGLTLKCESDTNWRTADGWRKILAIETPALPPDPEPAP